MIRYTKPVSVALVLILMLIGWTQAHAAIAINELMASNSAGKTDPQGEYEDWIELYNLSDAAVDLGGMYLTDDLDRPTKWQIPAGTVIEARGYVLVWADNDLADDGLHAAFSLSTTGEDLALFDVDGTTLLDSVHFDEQLADLSYGRDPDGTGAWSPMGYPTPGQQNVRVYEGFVAEPKFSPERGFYDDEIVVALTCDTPDARIYYTTDGTDPYVVAERTGPGASAKTYTEPLHIRETTCLRAAAARDNWKPSPIETQTYVFIADVIRQSPNREQPGSTWPATGSVNGQMIDYGMDPDVVGDPAYADLIDDALLVIPSISLVTDLDNLFSSQRGIYVNARAQGTRWERPVSIELLNPDGSEGFQIDGGIRIRGGYSRSGNNPKHAFRLFFRAKYGQSKLHFPLFGEEGVDQFDAVDLRTSQNYSWSFEGGNSNSHETFVREVFSRDTQRDMGQPYTRSRYYHLYINGHYWGLFQTQERSEASYAESYFGGKKEDYDVIKSRAGNGGYDIEATDGTLDAWRRLWEAAGEGFDNDEDYYRVQGMNANGTPNPDYEKLLDVDNLIDYMLCTYYVGDPDGPVSAWALVANNFYGVYNRNAPDGFKFFRHDAEHSLYSLYESRLFNSSTENVGRQFNKSNPLWTHLHLMAHPEYRMRFADRVYKYFFNDGVLTPQPCIDRFMARANEIELAIVAESARWGDAKRSRPRTRDDDWLPDINGMVSDYFPRRTDIVINQFRGEGWYPNINPPTLNQHGGPVNTGFQLTLSGSGDIYYTLDGTDPRLPEAAGGPASGLSLVPESAAKRVFVPSGPIDDAWRGGSDFDDSTWQTGAGGIGYERSTGYEPYFDIDIGNAMYGVNPGCYIRIPFDVTAEDHEQITGLQLKARYDDGFIAYLNGVEILRVMFDGTPSWNSEAQGNHSDLDAIDLETFVIAEHVDALRPGQNILALHGLNAGATSSDFLISVELAGTKGPSGGAAGGVSPDAIAYTGPVTLEASVQVKARAHSGGTWSALSDTLFAVGPVAETLRISEIMYRPGGDPNAEFIELTNIGNEAVNLNLAALTNGVDFVFGDVELAPDDYLLVVRDLVAFEARYGQGYNIAGQYRGSLANGGERLELVDAAGQIIHSFRFQDDWYDVTDGLGFSLVARDPQTTDPNAWGDKSTWRPSAAVDGSPGFDDTGELPALGAVVFNELLANPAAGESDWVELHNTTNQTIDLSGWFLSDDVDDLAKYEIAAGTILPAGGYVVFHEDEHFGNVADPGCHAPFALSRNGETLYLHSGADGALTGYSEEEKFNATETGVSLGRYRKTTGTYNFVALSEPTPGAANGAPLVGPIVITEIMYNPVDVAEAEYVEMTNISDVPVTFYDGTRG
ncbi:MAG: lamin tail domain-containing protein, partial [Phycisphaerales bacterium]